MRKHAFVRFECFAIGLILFAAPLAMALGGEQASRSAAAKHDQPATSHAADGDGERIFQQNCSRCHATPQGFPPEISGTVVRHMRIRASLSEKDARALLHFLNP